MHELVGSFLRKLELALRFVQPREFGQQFRIERSQLVARCDRPLLVLVLRQQLARVQFKRLLV